jgi:hypothetical protein
MPMELHDTLWCDMDNFIKECVHLFHDRWSKDNLSLFFHIQFFKQFVNIVFQCALTSTIERKITLLGDICSKPLVTIRSYDLHVVDIEEVILGEITSYHKRE